jgi:hypothetical protein
MTDMIEKKIYADGKPYYFNTGTTEKYGEILDCLAWPETEEGCWVIAAVVVEIRQNGDSQTVCRLPFVVRKLSGK